MAERRPRGARVELEARQAVEPDLDAAVDDEGRRQDLLRLIFIRCHLVLSKEAGVALTLLLLGGLATE